MRVSPRRGSDPRSSSSRASERPADVTLEIARPLSEQLGQAIDGTGFRSVTEFTVYVLRDLVASQRAEAAGAPAEQLSREQLDAVRLQALG